MEVQYMSLFAERLAGGEFVVTAELDPPRGTDIGPVMRKVSLLAGWIDALNITDSPRASMRMSPIALAHMIGEEYGLETVFHLTCRDRNVIGLQSELLGAAALGVRNILALSGDAPSEAETAAHHGVYEVDSLGLVRLAAALNAGRDDAGRKLNAATSFLIGVGANPNATDLDREADRVLEKVRLGAHFIQTQPVYEVETFDRLAARLAGSGVPILAGLLAPRTAEQLTKVIATVPGVKVPEWFAAAVRAGGVAAGLDLLAATARDLRGVAAGIHIMPMGDPAAVLRLAAAAGATRRVPAGRAATGERPGHGGTVS
jgi:5,10-methylenetetrahydrofolate reductase